MPKDKPVERKKMIVEEVGAPVPEPTSEITQPVEEIKEKVEELKTITEDISENIDKSEEVQEEIAEAAEKAVPMAPPQPIEQSRLPNPLIVLVPGFLLLGAILGGIYFFQKSVKVADEIPTPIPNTESASTPKPSASPVAKADLVNYPVTIENGIGIPGTAASAKELLIKAGFKVIGTGNADNYNYTDTIIKAGSEVPEGVITALLEALASQYKVGDAKVLSGGSKTSIIVIIGSSKP